MKNTLLVASLLICSSICGAAEPNWLYPWEKTLADYLKSIKSEQVETQAKPVDSTKFEAGTEKRHLYLGHGYTPLLNFLAAAVELPAKDFLWSNIWRPEAEPVHDFLSDTRHNLEKGQLWIPTHPNVANILAWAYSDKAAWNPYYHVENVGRRAAVISTVNLLCWTESDYYRNDKSSSYKGRKWGLHTAVTGFSLTFNAFTFLKVKDLLPGEVKKAWIAGLLHMCERINSRSPIGPVNMRLSIPVGMYYAYLGTGDEKIKKMYQKWLGLTVFGAECSFAGHYWDGGGRAPDGSYNGIALHRLAELYAITRDPNVLVLLRRAYKLKSYMSLPMPSGRWISPSHFNDRCQSSFANDQYQGRETSFVTKVPESDIFLKKFRSKMRFPSFETLAKSSIVPSKRVVSAFQWGGGEGRGGRMHDWANVMHLPDYMYHESEAEIQKELTKNHALPVLASERFTENFNNEFYCVRRPAYYAIFYAGSAVATDNGTTNYRGMLKNKGGLFNGFAGGGLSAFWTPAGTFIIGRMTAYEDYKRQEIDLGKRTVLIPGWRDWVNNHVIGETSEGKIITSARTSWPKSDLDKNSLVITGEAVKKNHRQKEITKATLTYKRDYQLKDDRLVCDLTLKTDQPLDMKSFYETIPLHITDDLKVRFLDSKGTELSDTAQIEHVKTVELSRQDGKVDLVFDQPRTIARIAKKIASKQVGVVYCQNLQVVLPCALKPDQPIKLNYELIPHTTLGMGIKQVAEAETYPAIPPLKIAEAFARYEASQGIDKNDQNQLALWKDLSKHGNDLKPFVGPKLIPPTFESGKTQAVVFNGRSALFASLKSASMNAITAVAVVDIPKNVKNVHSRIVSIVGENGADNDGLTLISTHVPVGSSQIAQCTKYYNKKPIEPSVLGVGQRFIVKDGAPMTAGNGLNGKIMEIRVYDHALPAAFMKTLKEELKDKYEIK